MKEVILTPEGYEKLKVEIDTLSTEKRREVADRIRVAREFGDIAENAEYDDAKNEQAMLEHKIAQLEERLSNARVIQTRDVDLSVVSIGAKVRLKDVDANQTVEYTIVGSAEADPSELKLSNESPGRQGDHRQEEGRDRRGQRPSRIAEVQDPRHQSRVARTGRSAPAGRSPAPPTSRRSRHPALRVCAYALSPPAVRRERRAGAATPRCEWN